MSRKYDKQYNSIPYSLKPDQRARICTDLLSTEFCSALIDIHVNNDLIFFYTAARGAPYCSSIITKLGVRRENAIIVTPIYLRIKGGRVGSSGFARALFDGRFVYIVDEFFDPEIALQLANSVKKFQTSTMGEGRGPKRRVDSRGFRMIVAYPTEIMELADVFRECFIRGGSYLHIEVDNMGSHVKGFVNKNTEVLEEENCIVEVGSFGEDAYSTGLAVASRDLGRPTELCRIRTSEEIEANRIKLEGKSVIIVASPNSDLDVTRELSERMPELGIRDIKKLSIDLIDE